MMDPIEEFNFKPITEGLGFHKKKQNSKETKEAIPTSSLSHSSILDSVEKNASVNPSNKPTISKKGSTALKSPLPKKEMPSSSSATTETPSKDVIDELVKSFKKPNETFIENTKTPQVIINPVNPQIDEESYPLPWKISPFFVDAMLVMALVLSALMIILLITKVDLLMIMMKNPTDIELWMTFPAMIIGMIFVYMTLTRLFLGATLGEMVFDLQLGTQEQQSQVSYNFLVIGRITLALLTGLITLPLASLIVRQDYLGNISGLRLFRSKR